MYPSMSRTRGMAVANRVSTSPQSPNAATPLLNLGLSITATLFINSPRRTGYCTRCMASPTHSAMALA